jgi:hypothetical protein
MGVERIIPHDEDIDFDATRGNRQGDTVRGVGQTARAGHHGNMRV